jgi:2-polyprenyl-3-methyl-5-hydroxy-6-metoxy-1,4-benzoquinol methylase
MARRREWHETFFEGLYAQVLARSFDDARSQAEARLVKRLLRLRKRQRVLDIPCGMGRLAIPLAEMGLVVTGVDRTVF